MSVAHRLAALLACAGLGLGALAALDSAARASASGDLLAHLDLDYVREVTTHLTTIGSAPGGFRVFGTPQDQETAEYLAGQMSALGLDDVEVEEVKSGDGWFFDGWLFEGASVDVAGAGIDATFAAASLGSVPGTGPDGVSGEVVAVGYGTAPEYEGLDVEGKIVFAWWNFDSLGIWPNLIATEAHLHGAKAAMIASGPGHIWYQAGGGTAIGSNDGECGTTSSTKCAPMVTISKRDAEALLAALSRGPVNATVVLNA